MTVLLCMSCVQLNVLFILFNQLFNSSASHAVLLITLFGNIACCHTMCAFFKTMDELANLLKEKLDLACLDVMSQASLLANPETNNLEYVKGNENIILCLWGNLSKNPRYVSVVFYRCIYLAFIFYNLHFLKFL